jgi:DNA-binding transcriptional regulator YdaS (Cro superfamily)
MGDMSKKALLRACAAVGGQTALARALGLSSQGTVSSWLARGLPAERVLAVEAASGVSRHLLRPDLYPVETGNPLNVASRSCG